MHIEEKKARAQTATARKRPRFNASYPYFSAGFGGSCAEGIFNFDIHGSQVAKDIEYRYLVCEHCRIPFRKSGGNGFAEQFLNIASNWYTCVCKVFCP